MGIGRPHGGPAHASVRPSRVRSGRDAECTRLCPRRGGAAPPGAPQGHCAARPAVRRGMCPRLPHPLLPSLILDHAARAQRPRLHRGQHGVVRKLAGQAAEFEAAARAAVDGQRGGRVGDCGRGRGGGEDGECQEGAQGGHGGGGGRERVEVVRAGGAQSLSLSIFSFDAARHRDPGCASWSTPSNAQATKPCAAPSSTQISSYARPLPLFTCTAPGPPCRPRPQTGRSTPTRCRTRRTV